MYKITKVNDENNKMIHIHKVLSIILYIVIIPIIIFNFTMIIKSFLNPFKIPDFLGYKNFIIISGSMIPTINIDDAILIKEVPQDEINVNDIISFRQGEIITTHRVVDIIWENGIKKYKTKGDNNNTADRELVIYEQIEGKYQFKLNGLGKFIEILQNKCVLVFLILIIVLYYWNSCRLEKRKTERGKKRQKYNKT